MKTAHKIALASIAYRAIHIVRAMTGRADRCIVKRDDMIFDLDLSQGIDFAIYLGIFEPGTRNALKELVKPSSVVLDIGANIGVHTLLLARLVGPSGRVLSFEPTEFAIQKLCRNLDLNRDLAKRVTPFHFFLASNDGADVPASIYSSWPLVEGEDLHAKHLGQPMPTNAARARSIDGVLAELGSSLEELVSFFVPNGYRFFHERTGRQLPSAVEELRRMVGDGASMNVVTRAS